MADTPDTPTEAEPFVLRPAMSAQKSAAAPRESAPLLSTSPVAANSNVPASNDPVSNDPVEPPRTGKRVSRWDRPPEPHDWRWVVGNIGRALITLGLLMFGFVAYQLWGTGIQTARAQNQLDNQFEQYIEDNGITPDTLAPATTTTTAVTVPGETVPPLPPVGVPPPVAVTPVVQDYGTVNPGDGLFQLVIPRIGVDYNVVAGVTSKDLAKGPGHFPDTNLPGQLGNAAVAGHRTGHGGPFMDLDKLQPGDEIQVFTRLGDAYAYIVTGSVVVEPTEYSVVSASDPNVATMRHALVTCDPKYTSDRRLVVFATLDTSRGSPVGEPLIFYGQDNPPPVDSVLPADDTTAGTVAASSPSTAETDTATTTAVVATETTASSATTETTSATVTAADADAENPFAGEDAFTQGWFDDNGAWLHVIAWGAVLLLIAYASYRVAKRYRRLYLAFLVGFVPMAVALYFFYENVNRLLPAAI